MPNDPCQPNDHPDWRYSGDADCDGDGLTNDEENTGIDDPNTLPDPRGYVTDPDNPDTDGDRIPDGQESIDMTDPADDCSNIGGVPLPFRIVPSGKIRHGDRGSFFEIINIDIAQRNNVKIYNRWGICVYDVDNYDNEARRFNGYSKGRVTISPDTQLPEGIYYYVIITSKITRGI